MQLLWHQISGRVSTTITLLKKCFKKSLRSTLFRQHIIKKYPIYVSMDFSLVKAENAHAIIVIGADGNEVLIHSCTHALSMSWPYCLPSQHVVSRHGSTFRITDPVHMVNIVLGFCCCWHEQGDIGNDLRLVLVLILITCDENNVTYNHLKVSHWLRDCDVTAELLVRENHSRTTWTFCLTLMLYNIVHFGLVTPYADRDLGGQWLRKWLYKFTWMYLN